MALEPITRQEKIIAGQDLTPITRMEMFLKNFGGGGGGGVQPDWNQNDSTAADYVKNRPFYTGDPVETVLVEESTVTFEDADGVYVGQLESTFSATVGETYKVSWDGTVYESVCADYNYRGFTVIGNLSIAGAGADTGEPFIIASNGSSIYIDTADTSASHTFSISGFATEVVKIDEKYLPENLATKSDVEVAQTTATNAQTTATNAQTTATNAQTTANNAKTIATNAQTTATNAQTTANNAKTIAENAVGADVVKGNYKLRIGEKKYAGYGFAILYGDSVRMNYTDTGIYDEESGSFLEMSGQSVFKKSQSSQKRIVITANDDRDTQENSIILYGSKGQYTSISADGSLYYSGNILTVGTSPAYCKIVRYVNTPELKYDAATKGYVDGKISDTEIFLKSSTADSTKQYKITVDDSGTLKATEVT